MEIAITSCKICNQVHTINAENTNGDFSKCLSMLCKNEIERMEQLEKPLAGIFETAIKIESEVQMGDKIILGPKLLGASQIMEDKYNFCGQNSPLMDIKIECHDVKEEILDVESCSGENIFTAYNFTSDEIQEETTEVEPSSNDVFLPEYQEFSYTHLENGMFMCNICGVTQTSECLKKHFMTHIDEKPFQCEICQRFFKRKSCLRRHITIHTGEKPFECYTCLKKFNDPKNLKRHMVTHTGERPYKCHDCGKDFSIKANLKGHMKVHSNERPFKCEICSKAFKDIRDLRKHKVLHADETPYRCNICTKGFFRRYRLRDHMKLKHSL